MRIGRMGMGKDRSKSGLKTERRFSSSGLTGEFKVAADCAVLLVSHFVIAKY